MRSDRRTCVTFNQDVGILYHELLDDLSAAGWEVELLVGRRDDVGPSLPYRIMSGPALDRRCPLKRLASWAAFAATAFVLMLRRPHASMLVTTNPPLTPWMAWLADVLAGRPYGLLVYDIYPEAMIGTGLLREHGLLARAMRGLNRLAMQRAKYIITLSDGMKQCLQSQCGRKAPEIAVIPNWADTDLIHPIAPAENRFRKKHGLVEKKVVMYSGSFSLLHDLETFVLAAEELADHDEVAFVLVGRGAKQQKLRAMVTERKLTNVLMLPYQPVDVLPDMLAAADIHVVTVDEGFGKVQVPSKTYTNMAAGAALLGICPEDSQVAQIIRDNHCGRVTPPGDAVRAATTIARLLADDTLRQAKTNARRTATQKFSRPQCTALYRQTLD